MQLNTPKAKEVTIAVSGLKCGSCVRHVRMALEEQSGVTAADVNLATREATVSFDPNATNLGTLIEAIRSRGYRAEVGEEQ